MSKKEDMARRVRLSKVSQIIELAMTDSEFYDELQQAYMKTASQPPTGSGQPPVGGDQTELRELLKDRFGISKTTVDKILAEISEVNPKLNPDPTTLWV